MKNCALFAAGFAYCIGSILEFIVSRFIDYSDSTAWYVKLGIIVVIALVFSSVEFLMERALDKEAEREEEENLKNGVVPAEEKA